MWTFLKGFAHATNTVHWSLSVGPGKTNGLDGEEGVVICLYPNPRHKSQPFTDTAARQMIEAKGEVWLHPKGNEWQINLDQMKTRWPQASQHGWLCGTVLVKSEFVQNPEGVFATDAALPVVLLFVTPSICNESMTSRQEPENGVPYSAVSDDIELLREVSSGAYGLVWESLQKSLNRKVAVKIIRADKANIATALQHAKALAKCAHPNIITVHFIAKVRVPDDGTVVEGVVMEWLEGKTLGDRLKEPTLLLLHEFEELFDSVFAGLRHIHAQQIAHGDLHAGNVMITSQGIKLIDIDFSKSEILSRLTSQSLEEMKENDVSELRYLVNRSIKRSDIDVDLIEKHQNAIRIGQTTEEVADAVRALLEECHQTLKSIQTLNKQTPAPKPDPPQTNESPLDKLHALGMRTNESELLQTAALSILSRDDNRAVISVPQLVDDLSKKGYNYQNVMDTIESLREKGFVTTSSEQHARFMTLTSFGLDAYLRCFDEHYSNKLMSITAAIAFNGLKSDHALSAGLEVPIVFVRHVLDVFSLHGACNIMITSSGRHITHVAAKLRSAAEKDKESGFKSMLE